MKKIRYFLLTILTVFFVLAAIVFFMTKGQPKITVDYLAEYNRISQPANYDPCQNAAQLYKEAFNSFIKMPKQLQQGDRTYAKWVDDFNNTEQRVLQKWLNANTDCFQKFRSASQRPYNWTKSVCSTGSMCTNSDICKDGNALISINFPEAIIDSRYISNAIAWNAKVNAAQGKYTDAFDDVLAIYRSGFQQCSVSRSVIEFQDNLQEQQTAMETASLIIAKTAVPDAVLKSFQQNLEEISDAHSCFFDFMTDKLTLYDILQRTYVYKPNGTGRLSWKHKSDFFTMCGDNTNWLVIKSCFVGPSQNEVKKEVDSYYEKIMEAFTLAPWEFNRAKPDFFENLFWDCQSGTIILRVYGMDYRREYYNYYNTQTQFQALLTTIAVIRYRQDKGYLPDALDELVKAGYLRQLPIDPYSGKTLVYSVIGEDFKIYSIGNNFKDDSGKGYFLPSSLCSANIPPDLVFWPPTELRKNTNRNLPIQESNQPK